MLIPISNTPRDYAWGSISFISELEGREPTGKPEAEIWYGDHPGSPSRVDDGSGRTLDDALADADQPPLPYLMKILAASMSLSIQAHPSRAQAAEGFAREEAAGIPRDATERLYRDENHKPEIIVALSKDFWALVGLRPLDRTRGFVSRLADESGGLRGVEALQAILEADGDDATVLHGALAWALSDEGVAAVPDVVAALRVAEIPDYEDEQRFLGEIAGQFPGDGGVIVALLMNLVRLRRGEALFAPAGVLHAYQDGLGVELMAASDNVLRGGLTPKHVDVPELLRVVDTTPGPAPVIEATPSGDGVVAYDVDVPDFALQRATVTEDAPVELTLIGTATVLVTAGRLSVTTDSDADAVDLVPGRAAVVAAASSIRLVGSGEAFIAQPGRS
ncbi:mannose-6-phosphate isomerase, class I [Microbacterium radiodurans]|uniref:mannose-6-phosphate isomerase n=1 Tax=Microbacterium radiodurans TaxID=661398 RepID=A0A5J5ISX4_9MICO|nr:mannose-6-phosphate isomerase, class I [Microbacterium radiodurans]KAA9085099.1 mannose-6-phosphate isomerase, class I [Microbacterium radiodurans]